MQLSAIVPTPLNYAPARTQIAYSDQCHEIRTPQMKHMILNVDSDPQLHRLLFIVSGKLTHRPPGSLGTSESAWRT